MVSLGLRRGISQPSRKVISFLSLYVVLLALPAIADAQCISQLTVQRVWTQDAAGNDKTKFAPGETLQLAAQLKNSYGRALPSAELIITTSFYKNSRTVDIPPGISTWTWRAIAPSQGSKYTVTVKVYDSVHAAWAMRSVGFTGRSPSPQGSGGGG